MLGVAVWASVALSMPFSSAANLVDNGNFSEASGTSGTGAAGWTSSGHLFARVTTPTLGGAPAAMSFHNTDPSVYELCDTGLKGWKPGYAYEVSAWVRTEGVTGDDSGATVCVQWSGANKSYLGGTFPTGVKGTQDWTRVVEQFVIPDNAASVTVSVYLRKGMTGKAWWDNVTVVEIPPTPMSTLLLEPAYRGRVTKDWPPRVRVRIAVPDTPQIDPASLDFAVTLSPATTGATPLATATVKGSALPPNRTAVADLGVDPRALLRPGAYRVTVVASRGGDVVQTDAYNVTRVDDSLPPAAVAVDGDRRLVVGGKPMFVLGMYAGGMGQADFDRFGRSPFNAVMPYQQMNKTQMDWAHAAGVKVAYTVKDDYCGHDLKCNTSGVPADVRAVTAAVTAFRSHPATLMWYLNDELGPTWVPTLTAHQQLVESLDYNHPTWSVLYEQAEVLDYKATCDTIGTDPYPIPGHNISEVRLWANDTLDLLGGTKAVFEVIQAHNAKNYHHDEGRTPTVDETRSMVWQAINVGANGIFFYSYFDIQRNPDVPFETEWARLSSVAAEVEAFAPCLLSDQGAAPPVAGGAPWLVTRERWCDPSTLPHGAAVGEMSHARGGAMTRARGGARGARGVSVGANHGFGGSGGGGGDVSSDTAVLVVFAVSDGSGGGDVTLGLGRGAGGPIARVVDVSGAKPRVINPDPSGTSWRDDVPPMALRVYAVTFSA